MKSKLVQQGPGARHGPGECLSTRRPYSDAGRAYLPLTLLGAPVNIGETRSRSDGLSAVESEARAKI